MREFLEDALDHRDDGYGRTQRGLKRQLPKRFYKRATSGALDDGHAVLLDGRPTRTPGRAPVRVKQAALAESMAAEWNAQGEVIDAETMPIVRLVNSAIEGGAAALPGLKAEILKYAGSDLMCYRTDSPAELREAQERRWDAILVALSRKYGVAFETTCSIHHVSQPQPTLAAIRKALEPNNSFSATALTLITGITGSALLALALRDGLVSPDAAWAAAHVDEHHNMRLWGADSEALKRLDKRRRDFDAGVAVLGMVGND
ncbi:MAG: ATPase [Alphaproteobacteria bacterium]|nr:ATPase [Alphaproteobacteria bacterium]